jgi:PncC family amidohydrolase
MIKNLEEVEELLIQKKVKISVAESMTGGLLAQKLTSISGSSRYFIGGIIVYSDYAKEKLLNVPHSILKKHGAISGEVAGLLAKNVSNLLKSDIGLSITGNAGPIAQESKPVGLVYIGIYFKGNSKVFEEHFSGGREEIREKACKETLQKLLETLVGG